MRKPRSRSAKGELEEEAEGKVIPSVCTIRRRVEHANRDREIDRWIATTRTSHRARRGRVSGREDERAKGRETEKKREAERRRGARERGDEESREARREDECERHGRGEGWDGGNERG